MLLSPCISWISVSTNNFFSFDSFYFYKSFFLKGLLERAYFFFPSPPTFLNNLLVSVFNFASSCTWPSNLVWNLVTESEGCALLCYASWNFVDSVLDQGRFYETKFNNYLRSLSARLLVLILWNKSKDDITFGPNSLIYNIRTLYHKDLSEDTNICLFRNIFFQT